MAAEKDDTRWRTDGKFFRSNSRRVWMKAVTYGPFPGGWPLDFAPDFSKMAFAGFNAIRLYEMPDLKLLDAALGHGLQVFGGLKWGQNVDFLAMPSVYSGAMVALQNSLKQVASHPAMAGVYVSNEIPSDLVRWMGPVKVRQAIEALIALGKEISPHLMFAYANYPSTEYLEPGNADFTAFNVYLEDESSFQSYLKRLHHIAGDRPLVISEFGLDSRRNGTLTQAETLTWGLQSSYDFEAAGITLYAWSDRWWNAGAEVLDWDFGLLDRGGVAKPGLAAIQNFPLPGELDTSQLASVIVCTRNGSGRIGKCLEALENMVDSHFEVIVVDDGSVDGTAEFVQESFPWVILLRMEAAGLSAARNAGAALANGEILAFTDDDCEPDLEWISRIRPLLAASHYHAACGPNLPPPARTWQEAVVCAAPGAPSHVMLDDLAAEHLPGCNFAVMKTAFEAVGGFDPDFQTAGDDVDFCWRLRSAGYHLGFIPGAFVWHWRRPSLAAFLRQQRGYGKAERLLMQKHPKHFSDSGETQWQGFIYGGGPVTVTEESIIYHGHMGNAGYQAITNRMLPLRAIDPEFSTLLARTALRLIQFLQPRLRAWTRNHRGIFQRQETVKRFESSSEDFRLLANQPLTRENILSHFLESGWQPASPHAAWDLEKGANKILLAIEKGELDSITVLLRVWGNPTEAQGVKTLAGLLCFSILSFKVIPLE